MVALKLCFKCYRKSEREHMNNMIRYSMSSGLQKPPFNDSYVHKSNAITETLDYHVTYIAAFVNSTAIHTQHSETITGNNIFEIS
jgi:hypothetical protein